MATFNTGVLFGTYLVPSIIDRSKTETRRLIKPGQEGKGPFAVMQRRLAAGHDVRIYVREAFKHALCECEVESADCGCRTVWGPPDAGPMGLEPVTFASDYYPHHGHYGPWKPGIHMKAWMATVFMPVASVTCERLSAITDDAALREGVVRTVDYPDGSKVYLAHGSEVPWSTPAKTFLYGFRSAYGLAPDSDPLVWVVTWKDVEVRRG